MRIIKDLERSITDWSKISQVTQMMIYVLINILMIYVLCTNKKSYVINIRTRYINVCISHLQANVISNNK